MISIYSPEFVIPWIIFLIIPSCVVSIYCTYDIGDFEDSCIGSMVVWFLLYIVSVVVFVLSLVYF